MKKLPIKQNTITGFRILVDDKYLLVEFSANSFILKTAECYYFWRVQLIARLYIVPYSSLHASKVTNVWLSRQLQHLFTIASVENLKCDSSSEILQSWAIMSFFTCTSCTELLLMWQMHDGFNRTPTCKRF